jgi:hypothetical protein
VACGDVCQPPYAECLAIVGWALEIWPDIHGQMVLNGVSLMVIDFEETIDLFYHAIINDAVHMEVSRREVRTEVDKRLDDVVFRHSLRVTASAPDAPKPQAEPFKLTPDMQALIGQPYGTPGGANQ